MAGQSGDDLRQALGQVHRAPLCDPDLFSGFPIVLDRHRQLRHGYACAPKPGFALEFGVFTGGSLRALAHACPKDRFTGFDSFKGLPEAWARSPDSTYAAGHFALEALPVMPANVTLVSGFFEESLPLWLDRNPGPVGFVHIDCDLYGGAKCVLDLLGPRLLDGAVIVFDELGDWDDSGVYPLWEQGEWRAFAEWLAETGHVFRILSRGPRFEAAVQVYRRKPAGLAAADILERATRMWDVGAQDPAVTLLAQEVRAKPEWLGGAHRLAQWHVKQRQPEAALTTIAGIWPKALQTPKASLSLDLYRLRAAARLRLGDLTGAQDDIAAFRGARPDHLGGLTLAAAIAGQRRDHAAAAALWTRAHDLTGMADYRAKAQDEAILNQTEPEFRSMKFSGLMVQHLLRDCDADFRTVLDIGSGTGEQAEALRRHDKIVTELDYGESHYFKARPEGGGVLRGDFLTLPLDQTWDCVLASHVLEHQLNVNAFLRKAHAVLREGGLLAISVPPMKPEIVGGHVTLWNAGLLLYNLVLAGFDCSSPWVRAYGYNISVVLRKRSIVPQGLVFDSGDIDRIAAFLPAGLSEGFNGDIRSLN
jgi:SAM-dependent methyltransferase